MLLERRNTLNALINEFMWDEQLGIYSNLLFNGTLCVRQQYSFETTKDDSYDALHITLSGFGFGLTLNRFFVYLLCFTFPWLGIHAFHPHRSTRSFQVLLLMPKLVEWCVVSSCFVPVACHWR